MPRSPAFHTVLTLFIMAFCAGLRAQAQTVELLTALPESTQNTAGWPLNTYYYSQRLESVYLSSDLTAAGITIGSVITEISLKVSQVPGREVENFRIRVANTTANTVPMFSIPATMTEVYGPQTLQNTATEFPLAQWKTFVLHTPFQWIGNHLTVDFTTMGTAYVIGGGVYVRNAGTQRTRMGYQDAGAAYPFDNIGNQSNQAFVPSLRVKFTSGLYISAPQTMPLAADGVPYNQSIGAYNGTAPYQWQVIAGSLPPGLTLGASGTNTQISGTPAPGTAGVYNFMVRVTDAAQNTDTRALSIGVLPPPYALPFIDDFSTFTGWSLGSGLGLTWQRGPCGPAYQPPYGNPEPTTDFSPGNDNMILGDNIGAVYPNNMSHPIFATSPPINCTGVTNVEIRFRRWLNVEQPAYDRAVIDVSPDDGGNWTRVWQNSAAITDNSWVLQRIDISGVAAGHAAVRVRFGLGHTDTSWQYGGWCIDDFEVRELPSTTKLVADDFRIISPYTIGSQADPRVYTAMTVPVEIRVNNTTPNDITVNSFAVNVVDFTTAATQFVGMFTLANPAPFVVPAFATSVVLQGSFQCTTVPAVGAGTALRAIVVLAGTEAVTASPVEGSFEDILYVEPGPPPPPPRLEVRELNFAGPLVEHDDSAVGTSRDLGMQDINTGPTGWINMVLLNRTNAPVNVSTPVLTGPDAAHFRLNTAQWTSPTMVLQTTGTASQIFFSVRFDPHRLGTLDAWVEFTHNATLPTDSPYVVRLTGTGTGTAPELEVREVNFTGPKVDAGSAAANHRNFGYVALGQSSNWLTLVLWNRFVTDTTIDPLPQITGPDAADFVLDTSALTPGAHVIPGSTAFTGTAYFNVRFTPQTAGIKNAMVSFGHDAANPAGPTFSFAIRGVAIDAPGTPLMAVSEMVGGFPAFVIENTSPAIHGRDFGQRIAASGPSAQLGIRVRNTGNTTLTLGLPQLGGPDPGHFVLDTTGYLPNINPGFSSEFSLAFNPLNLGNKAATVTFTHSALFQTSSPFEFHLAGIGIPDSPRLVAREGGATGPVFTHGAPAAGTARDFGGRDVALGASPALTIYLYNDGTLPMSLGVPTMTGDDTQFVLQTAAMTPNVGIGLFTTFTIAFQPTSYGPKRAVVSLTHNDTSIPNPFIFEVTGFGDAPSLEVREGGPSGPLLTSDAAPAGGRDFGPRELADMPSMPLTITIVNAGNAPLNLVPPTLSGHVASFTLDTAGVNLTVAPGANTSLTIRFDASQVGLKEAVLHIGDGVAPDFLVPIRGLATSPNGVRILQNPELPRARVGVYYRIAELAVVGGTPLYSWSVRPGSALPAGLTLEPWGDFYGTPQGPAGFHTFELRVTDANGGTDDVVFTLGIEPAIGQAVGRGSGGGSGCTGGGGVLPLILLALLALRAAYPPRYDISAFGRPGVPADRNSE